VKKVAFIVVSLIVLTLSSQAGAATPHFLPHGTHLSVKQKVAYFERSIHKDQTAIAWLRAHRHLQGSSSVMRWYKSALHWHQNLLSRYSAKLAPPPPKVDYWVARQISVATQIAQASGGDPWPNCPDPYDGSGGSWYDTVNCENGGNWYDSPGYYRCGLQFDPSWEYKYGRLCP
jgi:hypothetical protein